MAIYAAGKKDGKKKGNRTDITIALEGEKVRPSVPDLSAMLSACE